MDKPLTIRAACLLTILIVLTTIVCSAWVSVSGAAEIDRIDINRADPADLLELPEIDAVLADRIVGERRADGDYWSAADVAARVEGVGEKRAAALEAACVFRVRKP